MKKLLLLSLGLAIALPAAALEVGGVNMPETWSVEGKTLKLNGAGVRKKAIFKVYAIGLYVENPSKDGAAVVAADELKSVRLHVLRKLKGKQISDAIAEGFERNSKAQMGALKARLDRFASLLPDLAEGDELTMTHVPGKGTVVSVKEAEKGVIEGKDFADALFAVWLGADPVQANLKAELLKG